MDESGKSLNPLLRQQLSKKKKRWSVAEYVEGIRNGDRVFLGQAITLIESARPSHQELAQQIIEACLPYASKSIRIGITGAPGVGKSTFIEAFGNYITEQGHQLAVLAIDPSSQMTRGSILGDKTRMIDLSANTNAFIRPSPAGNSLGGVARKTRETIILCEAAGFDTILIETVGVGQSEISVHSMVDFFLLLLLPGAGDELQGIKRGIVEMADMIVVNKADGDRITLAKHTKRAYKNALHLFPPKTSNWVPEVSTCSALEKEGISAIWESIQKYQSFSSQNGFFQSNRKQQARYWLQESIKNQLNQLFAENKAVKKEFEGIESAVLEGKKSPFQAAVLLMKLFRDF